MCIRPFYPVVLGLALLASPGAQSQEVWITPEVESVNVLHAGEPLSVRRNQDRENKVNPYYAYTSRKCPPFCIQPIAAAPGVETIGELEVLDYLRRIAQGDQSVLVVDSRKAQWPKRGMIPGAVSIPWTLLDGNAAAAGSARNILMDQFGARSDDGRWDFSDAKTLVLYCNGMWCSQSTTAIDSLLHFGYPAEKLKWYRGGMQDWENLGLTTVKLDK